MCTEHRIICFCCGVRTTATNYLKCYFKSNYHYVHEYYEEKNNQNHIIIIKVFESLFSSCLKCKNCKVKCGKKVEEIEYEIKIKNYKKPKIYKDQKTCFIC
jgi:hypothetical protein